VIGSNILAFVSYKSFLKRKQTALELTSFNNNRQIDQQTSIERRRRDKKEKMNQKLLKMTIFLSIFSVITHIIQFGAQIILILLSSNNTLVYSWAFYIFTFMVIFKHFFTIFFFYNFNIKFKVGIKKIFY
jgi:hypothetical protein